LVCAEPIDVARIRIEGRTRGRSSWPPVPPRSGWWRQPGSPAAPDRRKSGRAVHGQGRGTMADRLTGRRSLSGREPWRGVALCESVSTRRRPSRLRLPSQPSWPAPPPRG